MPSRQTFNNKKEFKAESSKAGPWAKLSLQLLFVWPVNQENFNILKGKNNNKKIKE